MAEQFTGAQITSVIRQVRDMSDNGGVQLSILVHALAVACKSCGVAREVAVDELRAAFRHPHKLEPLDSRDPDYSRTGLFQTHNCWKCKDGERPCVNGSPSRCDNLHARND